MTKSIWGCALAVSVAVVVGMGQPGTAEARSFTIKTDRWSVTKLGPFKARSTLRYQASLRRAIRAFGRPSSRARRSGGCVARWKRLGLRIGFYNFGGSSVAPCHPDFGYAQNVAIKRSRKWRTWEGLRIGMRERAVLRRHPNARWVQDHEYHPDGWWLRRARSRFGDGSYYPVVSAQIGPGGRVNRFEGWIGGAGE